MPPYEAGQAYLAVDDVTKYVFYHYRRLLTESEDWAYRATMTSVKGDASISEYYAKFLPANEALRKEFHRLLADGPEKFLVATRDRLLKDHQDEIVLNHCPSCGALARTPQAKICFKCGHNWRVPSPTTNTKKI